MRSSEEHILLNLSLNLRRLKNTPALSSIDNLRDQLGMTESFATLHNAHDSSLRLEMTVGRNSLVCRLGLLFGLLQLDLVDLDAHLLVAETRVVRELIAGVHILALGGLG